MYTTTTMGTRYVAQITKRKNRLKVYKSESRDQIFLEDSEEFEIELFNPKENSVLAKISINGIQISSSGIVLRPGQRVYLERFLDSNQKFKFSTYEVENSKEAKEAIEKNGIIRVEFFDEYVPSYTYYSSGINYPSNLTLGGTTLNNTFTISSLTGTITTTNSTAGSVDLSSATFNSAVNSVETGRIEGGSKSNQEFTYTTGNFNFYHSQIVEYKILPASQKPVEISEIRNYCSECGVRNKSNWKFCPSCGNKF
jgi:hypothetical protein